MPQGDHLYDCYKPPEVEFVRGEGAYLYTEAGERYLDFIAGIAVNGLGHGHPALIEAVQGQSEKLWHLSNMFRIPGGRELAKKYCDALPWAGKVFFTNSGAEAVECAMKTARRYHYDRGDTERIEIITFTGAFHGRTFGTINAGGNPKYLKGFGPAIPGFTHLDFAELSNLEEHLSDKTAAVLFEPVQGEGGLRPVSVELLKKIRRQCTDNGTLVIYDEVQCGAGRTGKFFAHQWADGGAEPDIMAAAKGIGGGFPLGACIAKEEIAACMVPGTHGSTYGGNPMAMAVGHAAFDALTDEGLMAHVNKVSNFVKQQFEGLKDEFPDVVDEIRGKGLLIGLRLKKEALAVRKNALTKNLLLGSAGDNVMRMAPPLIIDETHVREAIGVLRECFEEARELPDFEI